MVKNYLENKIKYFLLKSTDWQINKEIRLKALLSDSQAFGSNYDDFSKKEDSYWIDKLDDTNNYIFVALVNNIPIGIIRITLNDAEVPSKYAYLGSLFVDNDYRGRGIATTLIQYSENYIKQHCDVRGVYLEVYASLINAINLYEKMGYNIVKKRKIEDNREDVVMCKNF